MDVSFDKAIFIQRTYTINKALSTIQQVQIINKTDFAIKIVNIDSKRFAKIQKNSQKPYQKILNQDSDLK